MADLIPDDMLDAFAVSGADQRDPGKGRRALRGHGDARDLLRPLPHGPCAESRAAGRFQGDLITVRAGSERPRTGASGHDVHEPGRPGNHPGGLGSGERARHHAPDAKRSHGILLGDVRSHLDPVSHLAVDLDDHGHAFGRASSGSNVGQDSAWTMAPGPCRRSHASAVTWGTSGASSRSRASQAASFVAPCGPPGDVALVALQGVGELHARGDSGIERPPLDVVTDLGDEPVRRPLHLDVCRRTIAVRQSITRSLAR